MVAENSHPVLYIEKQESLAQDRFTKNGQGKELHIVAKNIPFNIYLVSSVDLNVSPLVAKLVYDGEAVEGREVEQLKTTPIEYVAHLTDEGRKAAVEVKLGVLSSQHEQAYFVIRFSVVNPEDNREYTAYSHPMKVISKRNQVRKMMAKRELTPTESTPPPPAKRPALSNDVSDALARLEAQQTEQRMMLQLLLEKNAIQPAEEVCFDTALRNFIHAYKRLPQKERPTKVRRVLAQLSPEDSDNLFQFVSNLGGDPRIVANIPTSEDNLLELLGLNESTGHNAACQCQNCPHKQELERWDTFYEQFLADPVTPESLMSS